MAAMAEEDSKLALREAERVEQIEDRVSEHIAERLE